MHRRRLIALPAAPPDALARCSGADQQAEVVAP